MDQIIAYIEQNRDTYTREAIDVQLHANGYKPEEVVEAWLVVEARSVGTSKSAIPGVPTSTAEWEQGDYRPERSRSLLVDPMFWLVLVGFIILSYVLPTLLSTIFIRGDISLAMFAALQLVALVAGVILIERNRSQSMGLLIGVLAAVVIIPCVTFGIFLGSCLLTLT